MYFGFIEKQPQNRGKTEVKQNKNRIAFIFWWSLYVGRTIKARYKK